jgi:hypothetical protein
MGDYSLQTLKLAALILSYDTDRPHVEMPHFEPDEEQYYPDVSVKEIEEWLGMEHHGDCVNQPVACMRCEADRALHQAQWLLERWPNQQSGN